MILPLTLALLISKPAVAKLTVHLDQPTVQVSPDLYGIFFEEINNAGDGGIYAEMVRNWNFQDSAKPDHWTAFGGAKIKIEDMDVHRNALTVEGPVGSGIQNNGYWGMKVVAGEEYVVKVVGIGGHIGSGSRINLTLETPKDEVLAAAKIELTDELSPRVHTLKPSKSEANAHLKITRIDDTNLVIDYVSLFPAKTFENRRNGLRPDLAEMLFNMAPAFMRFPGGCWVEGDKMATAYRWKKTIGPVEKRASVPNLWNYVSGNGLGYHEYLQMCEDIQAAPLFVVNCGMSHKEVVPMDKMDEYVQDALDAIEYANGPATSKWGKERAKNGHPKPFNLKYVEIGNENGGPDYAARYPLFVKAIKGKYPQIKLIANVWGGTPNTAPVEIIDEHYYSSPDFFIQNADRYDAYDRKGPKVYVGEYAVTQGVGNGNLRGAIAEAAFMTGMERNSDIVTMSSYAPLFANVNAKNWNPDLIYFDSANVCGTPSYYVQKMFSRNRPDTIVKSELENAADRRGTFPAGGVGIGTWGTQAEFKEIKVSKDGAILYESRDGKGLKVESGKWDAVDGAVRQSSNETFARAWIGDDSLTEYKLNLKAKKVSGAEGFLITVGREDDKNYLWWNIGGWGNTLQAIERAVDGSKSMIGKQLPSKVETGKWYDIEIEYSPDHIVCKLDGKEVYRQDFPETRSIYAVTGKTKDGEAIVKVVNVSGRDRQMDVFFEGTDMRGGEAVIETLTSENPSDENTVDRPKKVFPKGSRVRMAARKLTHTFPAHSLTVIRYSGEK